MVTKTAGLFEAKALFELETEKMVDQIYNYRPLWIGAQILYNFERFSETATYTPPVLHDKIVF